MEEVEYHLVAPTLVEVSSYLHLLVVVYPTYHLTSMVAVHERLSNCQITLVTRVISIELSFSYFQPIIYKI